MGEGEGAGADSSASSTSLQQPFTISTFSPTSENELQGIILTAYRSLGGGQLVFRYPPVSRPQVSAETLSAMTQVSYSLEPYTLQEYGCE
tara:strand:+ start:233 stop:502 length:270 start_codon:yes stop_codon:yes gene_type:complete